MYSLQYFLGIKAVIRVREEDFAPSVDPVTDNPFCTKIKISKKTLSIGLLFLPLHKIGYNAYTSGNKHTPNGPAGPAQQRGSIRHNTMPPANRYRQADTAYRSILQYFSTITLCFYELSNRKAGT